MPVGPCAPTPAVVVPEAIPGLPSRPSAPLVPMAVSNIATLSIAVRVSASKPMLTTPLAAVEIAIPFLVASPFVVVEPVPVAFTVPVPDLNVNPVVTATVFNASSFAL